ncbi:MAG: phage tail sheath C-terminal domain-containing protein [Caldilineaceae bacterium]
MPVSPTYPGVYIEEVPSGVRTITGVSTSITAFVGAARRGPINKAVRVLSYSDFERKFGGLSIDSDLSYAVRQFFLNGGSDAYVVRLTKDSLPATRALQNAAGKDVLSLTALNRGKSGNDIEIRVDYNATNPAEHLASTFNLTLNYAPPDAPQDTRTETFPNLSMNHYDRRYVENVINDSSQLISVERVAALEDLPRGISISGDLTDNEGKLLNIGDLIDDRHNQFQVLVNSSIPPVRVQIAAADIGAAENTNEARLKTLCQAIENKVRAAGNSNKAIKNFTCTHDPADKPVRIKMTSGEPGEKSSVRILYGERNDLAYNLRLGTANGGTEEDAVATIRPAEIPERGVLTGGQLKDADIPSSGENAIPGDTKNTFKISIDGDIAKDVPLGDNAAQGSTLIDRLNDIARRIETTVRKLKSRPAYEGFTCAVNEKRQLVLISGTRGKDSSVVVSAPDKNDIAASLKLLGDAIITQPQNKMLEGGNETPYTPDDAYSVFIANNGEGIYALDKVDLFNILCLPGVTDAGILQDAAAYCNVRRAFLLIDAPKIITNPADMETLIAGPELPKSKDAAIYYPWLQIADPLNNGKLRSFAPSGTIAGLCARTDSTRGVWKAPAGTEATLVGVQGTTYTLTDGENGTLNPLGVNCIRTFPVMGTVTWGARTLRGADQMADEWKYIPVRRTALLIEESLYRGLQWAVFEPNDEELWAQIRLNVNGFMQTLYRRGAFQGATPSQAFFVKCDHDTNPQENIDRGIVTVQVGFAPLKPAEFVVVQISQKAGQSA